ncbi:MAG: dipeptidase [Gemmatimonadota bacterium]
MDRSTKSERRDSARLLDSDDVLLIDCHSDVMIDVGRRRCEGERNVLERVHLPRLREGGVAAAVCTVGGDVESLCPLGLERPFQSALHLLQMLDRDVAEGAGKVGIARSSRELRRLLKEGVFAVMPSLEGASPVGDDLSRLEQLAGLGVRCIGLTWNSRNELATGLGHEDEGLTSLGREAVREMNRLGIVVDLTHLGASSFRDVVHSTAAPVIASHCNARSVYDHPRNLDDDQLDAIRDVRGLVGVVFYPEFVAEPPVTVEEVLDQVEYLVNRMGVEFVGVGADFIDYAIEEVAAELYGEGADYDPAEFAYPNGLGDCRSLGNFVEGLRGRGFSESEVRQVAGENFLRVMAEVDAAAGG